MLNYEISKIIFNPLGIMIYPEFIIPAVILCTVTAICGVGFLALFFYRKKKNKKTLLSITSLNNKNQKKKPKNLLFSYTLDDLNNDLKPFGFAYYPPQDYFYSIMYGWQSECGYCELYDEGCAPLSMIIDCEPIYFKYGGKKWLIEFWKGQYGMNSGCEIGIYTTTGPILNIPGIFNGTFYFCAEEEDHLPIAFTFKKNGKVIFHRSEVHWWLTGFKLGEFSWPSELTVDIEITLKDQEMRDAFVEGMLKNRYTMEELTIRGNTVSFVYDTPHYRQPKTRTPYVEKYMQDNNWRNCEAYNIATRTYKNTVDKLNYVKNAAPKLYHKIINVGNTKELFKDYDLIRKFLGVKEPVRNIDKKNGIFYKELMEEENETADLEPEDSELNQEPDNTENGESDSSELPDEVNKA